MCSGAELALVLGSTAVQAANQNQARRQQDRIAADSLRRNTELNRTAGRRVSDEVQKLAESTPEMEQQDAQKDFMEALQRARVGQGGDALVGRGSERFEDDLGLARTAANDEGKRTAALLSRIDAPQFQRVREGTGVTNAATDLQLIGGRGAGQDFLDELRLARAQPNPGVDALAGAAGAYGMARAGRMKPKPTNLYTMTPGEQADITRGFRP